MSDLEIFLKAQKEGLDTFACIRIIRAVSSLSLSEAKEIFLKAQGTASSLDEYQEKLMPALEAAFLGENEEE